ncbi:MAG: hypothetical protein GX248_11210 [Peptococcaceae bacterium]|jgi:hypothetical protein|nr:hypothetical protein [Peptococcaceae bacterium]
MNKKTKKSILKWELSGIFFLVIVGFLLSFLYEWSNKSPLVGIIAPVNESVWEHLKLGFWSLIMFSVLEYWFIKNKTHNFFGAKGLGILILQGTVLIIYYTYTMFAAEPVLVIDILAYILGCILCQLIGYRILTKKSVFKTLNLIGLFLLFLHAILLIAFTFFPPKLPIFQDPKTLTYGIYRTSLLSKIICCFSLPLC